MLYHLNKGSSGSTSPVKMSVQLASEDVAVWQTAETCTAVYLPSHVPGFWLFVS